MSDTVKLPDELRRAIAADLRPVRPLPSPTRRAVLVAAWVPVGIVLILALLGLRRDLPSLGWAMMLVPVALEAAIGLLLVVFALAESVPARGVARGTAGGALALAAVGFVFQAALTRSVGAGAVPPGTPASHGLHCFELQALVGVPALVLVAILVVRAAPLRAAWAGLLGGAGAGMLADAIYHLHCPITDLRHVLVWHGAASAVLAVAGLAAGVAWEKAQRKRWRVRSRAARSAD